MRVGYGPGRLDHGAAAIILTILDTLPATFYGRSTVHGQEIRLYFRGGSKDILQPFALNRTNDLALLRSQRHGHKLSGLSHAFFQLYIPHICAVYDSKEKT